MKTSVAAAMPESPPPVLEELKVLTPKELAELLHINVKTVYDRISRGEVPGVIRSGRTVRLARPAIVAWLSSGDTAPAKARGGRVRR